MKSFTAVAKHISFKTFFTIGVSGKNRIRRMKLVTPFVYGLIDEVIYIKKPQLFVMKLDQVCKLIKAL